MAKKERREGAQENNLDERIIMELSKHIEPVAYSEFRDKFDDPEFVERLGFLIMTEKVTICSWREEESRYPDEVREINDVYQKYESEYGSVAIEDVKQYVLDLLDDRVSSVPSRNIDKDEPYLFYKPNFPKLMDLLRSRYESSL